MQQKLNGKITNHPEPGGERSDRNTINPQPWWGTSGILHHAMISDKDHDALGVTMSLSTPNRLNGDSSSLAKQSRTGLHERGKYYYIYGVFFMKLDF